MTSKTRKTLATLLAAVAVAGLAACGQTPQDATTGDTAAQAPAAPAAPAKRSYPAGMFEHAASAALRAGGQCALDRINKQPVGAAPYTTGQDVLFAGWFVPPKGVATAQPLLVLDDGTRQFAHEIKTGGKRDDVANRLQRPEAATSGYNAKVNLGGVPSGDYAVWLVQEGAGGFRCETRKTITVAP